MQEFDRVASDVDCNHDCSCRVTVFITDDFHCVKLGEREHPHHLGEGLDTRQVRLIETRTSSTSQKTFNTLAINRMPSERIFLCI